MTTHEKIKRLRETREMTLEYVGNAVGVGKSTVRKWETGMIDNMRRDKIEKLSELFCVDTDYLIKDQSFTKCPVCGYLHDPLVEDEYHEKYHVRFLKAEHDFGRLERQDVAETKANVCYEQFKIADGFDIAIKFYEGYLEYSLMVWLYENNFRYSYTNSFAYEWKQCYVRDNLFPDKDIDIEKCNYARQYFSVEILTKDECERHEQIEKVKVYDKYATDSEFLEYIETLWKLPKENKQAIYDQIEFQKSKINKQ